MIGSVKKEREEIFMGKKDIKITDVAKVYKDATIGKPFEEMNRRKVLFDAGHTVGNLVRVTEMSLDDILEELSTYPRLIDIISAGDSKHIQIDARYIALKDEVVNRTIQQHIAKQEINKILEK